MSMVGTWWVFIPTGEHGKRRVVNVGSVLCWRNHTFRLESCLVQSSLRDFSG